MTDPVRAIACEIYCQGRRVCIFVNPPGLIFHPIPFMILITMGGMHLKPLSQKAAGLLAMFVTTAIYGLLYALLERTTSGAITAASILPVMTAGAFFGLRVGLAAGGIGFLLNLILPALTGFMSIQTSLGMGSIIGGFAMVAAGGFVGWMRDQRTVMRHELSRRKMMERALRTSEDRLLRITNHILDIVIYTDAQGIIRYANPAFQEVLGYPPDYAAGRSVFEFLHPDDRAAIINAFQQAVEKQQYNDTNGIDEYRCISATGESVWVETSSNVLRDENHEENLQMIITARDITRRKNQDAALRESSAMVRALLNSPNDMALLIDRKGIILEINQAAARRLGGSVSDLVGKCIYDIPDPMNELWRARAHEVVRTHRLIQSEDNYNGSSYESTVYPILNTQQEVEQLAIFIRDVTIYKNAEHAEREQRQLAQALANTAEVLSSTLDFNEVLNQILDNIEKVVPYEAVEVMLVENDLVRVVRYQTRYGRPRVPELEQGVHLSSMENLSIAAATRQPVLISDTRGHPGWVVYPESVWVNSYVCAPIEVQGSVVGFLNLFSSKPGFFSEVNASRLHSFADQAAVALQNARLYSAAQTNAQQMALLNDITRSAIHANSRQDVTRRLVSSLGELFNTQGVYITQWDEDSGQVAPAGASAANAETYLGLSFPAGEPSLTAAVLSAGRVIAEDDAFASPLVNPTVQARMPERSIMGIPLIADGRKLGAVLIGYRQPHHFTHEEIQLAELVGPQIALVMAKTELLERETSQRKKLARANRLITSLGLVAAQIETSANVDEILAAVGKELKALGISCLVAMGNQADQKMTLRYISLDMPGVQTAEKLTGLSVRSFSLSERNFLSYPTLVNERRPVFLAHISSLVEHFSRFFPLGFGEVMIKSVGVNVDEPCIFLPMQVKEEIIGFLGLWGSSLDEEDIPALSLFSSQLATALEKGRLHDEVQRLSITDDLSGVYNRRGLLTFGHHEVERAHRFNRPLAVMMLDIDLFKQINDTHGHLAGDLALRALADCCLKNVREVDIVGRYGGDEFIILLIESDPGRAMLVAERLRKAISKMSINAEMPFTGLTVSCGVTRLSEKVHTLDDLINRADKALYMAKEQGRNQVYWMD